MEVIDIAKKIEQYGGRLYLVGGAVRDEFLKVKNTDEDYCVVGLSCEEFESMFPNAYKRGKDFPVYDIDGKEFAMARKEKKVGEGHTKFEIEISKNITIEDDLKRRDITINSIAKDVLTGKIIDPFNGIKDINDKVIKMTSSAFSEDPLRVYRVARFAAVLEFNVDEKTICEMKRIKEELKTLSSERVFMEFKKALNSKRPSIFFEVLRKSEVLEVHFKEIYDLIGKTQPVEYHPEGDGYNHTMIVLDSSCKLTNRLEIRYSCLVHDLGKGATPIDMLPHHYGHEERGVKLVQNLSNRLKVPNMWKKCGMISAKEHMRGGKFNMMSVKKQVDFIERVSKSDLGLDGMKIVVACDRNRYGGFPNDIIFDVLGKKCMKKINGSYIINKYNLKDGMQIKQKLHEERINWLKKEKNKLTED